MSGNLSQLTATCSSLMDWSVNDFARRHERVFGNRRRLLAWVRGAAATSRMRESALMLWGGSYAVKMDQLQDDFTKLKSFLVRDVLLEDQYILISRAERIRAGQPQRIRAFLEWLEAKGLAITRDPKMVTDEALAKQSALLLAARTGWRCGLDENIRGVSIKCQHEIYAEYGVNACMPAGLPAVHGERAGPQRAVPDGLRGGHREGAAHRHAPTRRQPRGPACLRGPGGGRRPRGVRRLRGGLGFWAPHFAEARRGPFPR